MIEIRSRLDDSVLYTCHGDLRGANLSGADLSYANLHHADLHHADLGGTLGLVRLPVADPRGYDALACWSTRGWVVFAGCRRFLVEQAVAHWGAGYLGDREIGNAYLFALGCLAHVQPPQREEKGAV